MVAQQSKASFVLVWWTMVLVTPKALTGWQNKGPLGKNAVVKSIFAVCFRLDNVSFHSRKKGAFLNYALLKILTLRQLGDSRVAVRGIFSLCTTSVFVIPELFL